jgi:hypothetical protein
MRRRDLLVGPARRTPDRTAPSPRRAPAPPHAPAALDADSVEHLQREAGNRAVADLIVQRDRRRGGPKPPLKVGGGQQQLWVVRDAKIALGGRLVADLAAFKKQVMTTADADGWTLVLAIHGSEDRLGAQAPPDWQKNAVFYDKSDVEALFADKAFVAWREKFGPTALSLVSCQVSAPFEDVLLKSLTRGKQPKRGLGEGCKPMTRSQGGGSMPGTKAAFDKLDATTRESALDELDELNKKWGYYGAPPVPRDLLAHYYYLEEPKGEWVIVEVGATSKGKLKATGIAFWDRTTGPDSARFRDLCSQGIGTLREHRAVAPPDVDDE